MAQSSSVQFFGIESVLKCFENRNIEAWSIYQNKQFLFKGIGSDSLQSTLSMLLPSGSTATYTLRVYEGIDEEKQIKGTTPDDGSFNFKLFKTDGFLDWPRSGPQQNLKESEDSATLTILKDIQQRLDKLENEEQEEEQENSLGIIGKIIEHPTIQPLLPQIMDVISGLFKGQQPPQQPQQLQQPQQHNMQQSYGQPMTLNGINEDQIIQECILLLKKHDPDLATHLQKLVSIAENEPGTFTMFLNLLK